ncbi:amidohydrolase [Phenylobacterium parvum]|uniref:Amidohydrolase n=1 Tax=Phenylobacterium parvum TaxID=2201350 RepID=A0A2Z3I4B2_9CAUL|nr:amidohydrolase [Phenylobacterium parvum]AWM78518.1 amidohydrolase [Phenylobacterium parvum]
MQLWTWAAGVAAAGLLAGCAPQAADKTATVYTGGDILTLAGETPTYVEALAVRDGKVVAAGSRADAVKAAGPGARKVDLKGQTLLPGFIDTHSHLLTYADSLVQANLNPPPVGGVKSIPDILAEVKRLKESMKAGPGVLLVGQGYDPDFLAEKRHPTAAELDAAFPDNPVILMHASGHMLVANSQAMKTAGVTAATPDPEGGAIIRKPGSREPEGLFQETAMHPFIPQVQAPRPQDQSFELIRRAVDHYAANGYTTASEGLVMPDKMPLLQAAADKGLLKIDVEALPAYLIADQLVGTGKITWGQRKNGLKWTGIKLATDGSPQGKTAYLTKPYMTPVPGCKADCRGFPNIPQDELNRLFVLAYKDGVQIYSHCNGDASVDMMIAAHRNAEKTLGKVDPNRRTVIIHSQIMRPDQMASYKALGLLPSFFTNHVYYWGDVHLANLGPERAAYISPLASALKSGVKATNHTDSIVTPLDPMFLVWTAVNRVTRAGKVLGPDERVTPYQALQALTVNGAYTYFDEASKGSLEVGKTADLVILDRNPLKVEPNAIRDIKVVETVKTGKSVYQAPKG